MAFHGVYLRAAAMSARIRGFGESANIAAMSSFWGSTPRARYSPSVSDLLLDEDFSSGIDALHNHIARSGRDSIETWVRTDHCSPSDPDTRAGIDDDGPLDRV